LAIQARQAFVEESLGAPQPLDDAQQAFVNDNQGDENCGGSQHPKNRERLPGQSQPDDGEAAHHGRQARVGEPLVALFAPRDFGAAFLKQLGVARAGVWTHRLPHCRAEWICPTM